MHTPRIGTLVHTLSDIYFLSCLQTLSFTQTQWKQCAAIKQFSPPQLPYHADKGSHSVPQMVDDVPCC